MSTIHFLIYSRAKKSNNFYYLVANKNYWMIIYKKYKYLGGILLHNIINSSSKRMIKLMEILVTDESESHLISNIIKKMNISLNTIIKDLNKISSYVSETEGLYLLLEKNNSIINTNLTFETFFIIKSKILLDSMSVKVLLEFIKHPYNDIKYYSGKLYVSNSSIYRRITTLNNYLEAYGLSITNQSGLYYINFESEYEYRRFVTSCLLEIYGKHVSNIIPFELISFFNNRQKKAYKKNLIEIIDYFDEYFFVFYFISIDRETKGHHIKKLNNYNEEYIPFSLNEIKSLQQLNVNLSVERLHVIESTICINHYIISAIADSDDILNLKGYIDNLFLIFNLPDFSNEKDYILTIFTDIYVNLTFFKVPLTFLNQKCIFFTDKIKIKHPIFYKKIKHWMFSIEKDLSLLFSLYESYLIYHIVISMPSILNYYVDFPIRIVSDVSKEHAEFIKSEMLIKFKKDYIHFLNFSCIDKNSFNVEELEKNTLLLSDFNIQYENVILIDQYPNLEKIKKALIK